MNADERGDIARISRTAKSRGPGRSARDSGTTIGIINSTSVIIIARSRAQSRGSVVVIDFNRSIDRPYVASITLKRHRRDRYLSIDRRFMYHDESIVGGTAVPISARGYIWKVTRYHGL